MNAATNTAPEAISGLGDKPPSAADPSPGEATATAYPPEHGGRKAGLEPTRYGDWEKDGRCIDF